MSQEEWDASLKLLALFVNIGKYKIRVGEQSVCECL